jgi:hypothetical protein
MGVGLICIASYVLRNVGIINYRIYVLWETSLLMFQGDLHLYIFIR